MHRAEFRFTEAIPVLLSASVQQQVAGPVVAGVLDLEGWWLLCSVHFVSQESWSRRPPAHFSTDDELDPSFNNLEGARHLHVESVKDAAQFQTTQPAIAQPVAVQNDKVISTNTRKLRSILECALFCARQNIGAVTAMYKLVKAVSAQKEPRPGNFLSLLHFRAESGDQTLKGVQHFDGKRTKECHIQDTQSSE